MMRINIHSVRRVFLSGFLIIALLLSTPISMVYAAEDTWALSGDTSWYDPENPMNDYDINTAEQLAGLALLVNEDYLDFEGVVFSLQNDLNLSGREWVPIGFLEIDAAGYVSSFFNGTFLGNGHTISGLSIFVNHTIDVLGGSNAFGVSGLFGFLGETALVDGLTVDGIVNVTRVNNNTLSDGFSGGIAGYNMGTITNCVNKASVSGQRSTGGISGIIMGGSVIRCSNEGNISGGHKVGGISGGMENGTLKECFNVGSVSGKNNSIYLGGILGSASDGDNIISNCYNQSPIQLQTGSSAIYIGGIAGSLYYNVDLSNCYNTGNILVDLSSTFYAGALVGEFGNAAKWRTVIRNSFYLDSSYDTAYGRLKDSAVIESLDAKSHEDMESESFLELLNDDCRHWGFAEEGGYPVLLYTIPADYSEVHAAVSEIPEDYPSGYTKETADALETALSNVIYGKSAFDQELVDKYSSDIRSAIAALEPVNTSNGGGNATVTHTIHFQTNGGSEISSIDIINGSLLSEPDAPAKDGYIFGGWYSDELLTSSYNFSEPVSASITLYAKWVLVLTPSESFEDVPEDYWAYEDILSMSKNGYLKGISSGIFSPLETTQRAMTITVLWRMAGKPLNDGHLFHDVSSGLYFSDAVSWANTNEIVLGVSETQFAPYSDISREQLAAILYRYARLPVFGRKAAADLSSYIDANEISDYALAAMEWCVANGLIIGRSEVSLAPKGTCTRAELATILNRFLSLA